MAETVDWVSKTVSHSQSETDVVTENDRCGRRRHRRRHQRSSDQVPTALDDAALTGRAAHGASMVK